MFCQGLRHARHTQNAEKLWNLVQNIYTQLGSTGTFLKTFRNMLLDEKTTPQRRVSGGRALLHLLIVSDKERMRLRQTGDQVQLRQLAEAHLEQLRWLQMAEQSPQDFLCQLHAENKLVPALREMLRSGEITMADLDPPQVV